MADIPQRWILRNPTDTAALDYKLNDYSPQFSRLLYSRGLKDIKKIGSFLNPSLKDLYDPFLMPGMKRAAVRLNDAVSKKEKIVIFGDYDADGIISSALIYNFLLKLGIRADIHIPDRINEGYDLGTGYIKKVTGEKDLIICVDCGTNNIRTQENVRNNKESPDVIACDHHNPTLDDYPEDSRYIIVNPKLPGSGYPFQGLSGGGVTFKFLIAVLRSLPEEKKKSFKSDYLNSLLDLVAISTLADLMPLLDENRILAGKGLKRIQYTKNSGLKTLINISLKGRKENIGEYEVGFVIAPRLNAAGRVKDAIDSFRLLSDDDKDDVEIAARLDSYNLERQSMQGKIFDEIMEKYDPGSLIPDSRIFVASSKDWNEGVLGIVASDLVKTLNVPVILFRQREEILKGSGRSIPEFSLHGNLSRLQDLFIRFGGHDQACGITMKAGNFTEFREKITGIAEKEISLQDLVKKYEYDIELDFTEIDIDFARDIQKLKPFGRENSCPSFITRECTILGTRKIKEGRHIKLDLEKNGIMLEAIMFNMDRSKKKLFNSGSPVDILYEININTWRKQDSIQLIIRDLFQKN